MRPDGFPSRRGWLIIAAVAGFVSTLGLPAGRPRKAWVSHAVSPAGGIGRAPVTRHRRSGWHPQDLLLPPLPHRSPPVPALRARPTCFMGVDTLGLVWVLRQVFFPVPAHRSDWAPLGVWHNP